MNDELKRVEASAVFLQRLGAGDAQIALVLGSGLRTFGDVLTDAKSAGFGEVPGFPVPRVEGHGGRVLVGTVGGTRVACLTGRVHLYEGWTPAEVVRPVRALRRCGVDAFVLTNAAGGIADDLAPGDLMRIDDHLNLTGSTPLCGAHESAFGPRFPDQSAVWDDALGARLMVADDDLQRGVYAGMLGPTYETPAEVRMLRTLGASAVGMSTVHEAIALNAMGARVCGVSLVSNLAAGLAKHKLSHDEVIAAGKAAEGRLVTMLTRFCSGFPGRITP